MKLCGTSGCGRPSFCRGMCRPCYRADLATKPKRFCSVTGCGAPHFGKGCCTHHYDAHRRATGTPGNLAHRACSKKWAQENPDRVKENLARWRASNPQFEVNHRAQQRRKYAEDPDLRARVAAKTKAWRRANPEAAGAINARRRARINSAEGRHSRDDRVAVLEFYGYRCCWCAEDLRSVGKRGYAIDHIIPLSVGGGNGIENLQPLCTLCNTRKGAKLAVPGKQPLALERHPRQRA